MYFSVCTLNFLTIICITKELIERLTMKEYLSNFKNQRLKHSYMFIYPVFYMLCFIFLEQNVEPQYIIHFRPDNYIPFCEYFIVPYLMWFLYVAVTVMVFYLFLDIGDFYRLTCYLFSGMTIFLLVSLFLPNGLELRPYTFERDNIFTDLVKNLYSTDTATNVFPSIHVFNSICVHVALAKNAVVKKHKVIVYSSFILAVLIILSTMFLKQHSILDVTSGIILSAVLYPVFYVYNCIPYRKEYPIPVNNAEVLVR